jgi:hypothetical protein
MTFEERCWKRSRSEVLKKALAIWERNLVSPLHLGFPSF